MLIGRPAATAKPLRVSTSLPVLETIRMAAGPSLASSVSLLKGAAAPGVMTIWAAGKYLSLSSLV